MMFFSFFHYIILSLSASREAFIKEIFIESDNTDSSSSSFNKKYSSQKKKEKKDYSEYDDRNFINYPEKCYVVLVKTNFNYNSITTLKINMKYTKNIPGFSFCTKDATIYNIIKNEPSTLYIEEDQNYYTAGLQTNIPNHMFYILNFGYYKFINYILGNVIMDYLPFRSIYKFFFGYYKYKYTGKNVTIYLLDTTVNTAADDISGRVVNVYNKSSCNQHGTNVATILAGRINGYAKDAIVNVLNVLDCEGKAPLSIIIAALENVKANSLLCIPISGPKSNIFNTVINEIATNTIIVTAAGNNSDTACDYSPGSAEGVLNVGSVDKYGNMSIFSNFNSCLKLYALGEDFRFDSIKKIQGTSYSAALVASSIAIFLEYNPEAKRADVWKYLVDNSYKYNNWYYIQKLPDMKTMKNVEVNVNDLSSYDVDDGFNVFLIFFYIFICIVIVAAVIYFLRRKKEDLIF